MCPLNGDAFLEIFKQSDATTLEATVALVDDLSSGVTLLPLLERIDAELLHCVESMRGQSSSLYPLGDMMWSRVSYILGFITPSCPELPPATNLAMQKAFADSLWALSLSDMLDVMGPESASEWDPSFEDISDLLNKGKRGAIDEHASYKGVYLSEIAGILDVYKENMGGVFQYMFERDTGQTLTDADIANDESGRYLGNVIYYAVEHNRIGAHLPSIRIGAALHAAVRWDRRRNYRNNDLVDFRHAQAALPYCDLFLTERSLCNLIGNGRVRSVASFPCKVCWSPRDALAALDEVTPRLGS